MHLASTFQRAIRHPETSAEYRCWQYSNSIRQMSSDAQSCKCQGIREPGTGPKKASNFREKSDSAAEMRACGTSCRRGAKRLSTASMIAPRSSEERSPACRFCQ